MSTCTEGAASSEISSAQTTVPSLSSTASVCPLGQTMSCAQLGMGVNAFSSCACAPSQEPTIVTSTPPETTAPISITPTSCPPGQILTCGKVGMGEHAFSSCACVQPPESTSVTSTTPVHSLPVIFTTIRSCLSYEITFCMPTSLGEHQYTSCGCVATTATSTCHPGATISCVSKEGYNFCICVHATAPPPAPTLLSSLEPGTIGMPDSVTTCVQVLNPDVPTTYTLCPRDSSRVHIAETSTVQGDGEY